MWFPVHPLYEALYRIVQLFAVRNQEASTHGLNTSSVVIIGATASVRYRKVVRLWEGPL